MDSSSFKQITIIENSRVAPSSHYPTDDNLLPLTFFDSYWFPLEPVHAFLFYEHHSADQTIIPSLKTSLSIALNHYYPLAGNFVLDDSSNTSSKLEIRYAKGDSVSLTIAECSSDFEYFARKDSRNVRELLPLIPHLPPSTKLSDSMLVPLLALQLTIFPKKGICIAFTLRHVACDGSTMMAFKKAWASIHKHGSDVQFLASGTVPSYDRSLITDNTGFCKRLMEESPGLGNFLSTGITVSDVRSDMLRRSFLLSQSDIKNLKRSLLTKHPKLVHVTSFVVTLGYAWSCLVKSRGEKTYGNEKENFVCAVDFRTRLKPPLPETYFGNCLWSCSAFIETVELLGDEGFINGAMSIGESISRILRSVQDGARFETLMHSSDGMGSERLTSVAGSPKFKINDIDFGWGKPERFDTGFNMGAILLNQPKDSEGLEISLSLPQDQMHAFSILFADNLQKISTVCV